MDAFGRIDVLFSNAGVPSLVPSVLDLSEAEWDRVIDVNLKGAFLMTRAVVPHMIKSGQGAIVLTGSDMSFVGDPLLPAYNASKGGVLLLMKSLALGLIGQGIRVNAVCPGTTDTPLLERELRTALDPARRAAAERDRGSDRAHGDAPRGGPGRALPRKRQILVHGRLGPRRRRGIHRQVGAPKLSMI